MHVWLTTLTIQRLFLGMLKAKLGSVLSSVYLAMISIRVVYFAWEGGHQRRGTTKERAEMELLKGAENLARNKVEAPKPKRRLLDIGNSTQAERVSYGYGLAPQQEEAEYV